MKRLILLLVCIAVGTTAHAAKSYTCTATVVPTTSNAPAGSVPSYICDPLEQCNEVDIVGTAPQRAAVHARLVLPDGSLAYWWAGAHNTKGRVSTWFFNLLPPGTYGVQLIDANKSTPDEYFVFAQCGFTVL